MSDDDAADQLLTAARVLDHQALVTAFGHVSARTGDDEILITPGIPLGQIPGRDVLVTQDVKATSLADGAPGEAWLHKAIYESRPDVGGVCRAQPPNADAAAACGIPIVPRHGQGVFVGEVAVYEDSRLIRNAELGAAVSASLGDNNAVMLRGNGAVTVGASIGEAVARMWVLERSGVLANNAAVVGSESLLGSEEIVAWEKVAPEVLGRMWAYLVKISS